MEKIKTVEYIPFLCLMHLEDSLQIPQISRIKINRKHGEANGTEEKNRGDSAATRTKYLIAS